MFWLIIACCSFSTHLPLVPWVQGQEGLFSLWVFCSWDSSLLPQENVIHKKRQNRSSSVWEKGLSSVLFLKEIGQYIAKEQGEPSEEKIPALRQATDSGKSAGIMLIMLSLTWGYSSSYSLTFHVVWKFLVYPVRQPSPNFRSHPGRLHLSKCYPCLISLIPGGSPWCFPNSFGDVLVQHRAEEERKFISSTGFGFGFSLFCRRRWSTARIQPESRNSSLSLIETIWLASLSCKKTRWAWWQILIAWRQVFLSHLTARGRKLIWYPLYLHTPGKGLADLLTRRCRMGSCR